MRALQIDTRSLRSARMRSLAPRATFYAFVAILCIAGLRSILAGPVEPAPAAPPRVIGADLAAESFAEGFARAYLTWSADSPDERPRELTAYLPSALDEDGGLTPAEGTDQTVRWTAVTRTLRTGRRVTVTVAASTTNGQFQLAVPVERDKRGFVYIAGYPALVGLAPVQRDVQLDRGDDVEDAALVSVVGRAIKNYLSGAEQNLRADLTPNAVVTLPPQRLTVTDPDDITWIVPQRRVAIEVEADDAGGGTWTLRYELDVRRSDRWYVRSIQNDPTSKGVSR